MVKINDYQKERFAQKIIDHFGGDLTGKKITVLGWAFKANTNDSRESAAIYVSEFLYEAGADLIIYDPMVLYSRIQDDLKNYWKNYKIINDDRIKIIKNFPNSFYDAVLILTEWDMFKKIEWDKSTKIFDGRNIINARPLNYFGI